MRIPQHNYLKRILQLQREGKIPPGRVIDCTVTHEDRCSLHRGGRCNSAAEVTIRPVESDEVSP